MSTYKNAPNKTLAIGRTKFAYRELGPVDGEPIVLLNHWGAVLDNFDPYIIDALEYVEAGRSKGKVVIKIK